MDEQLGPEPDLLTPSTGGGAGGAGEDTAAAAPGVKGGSHGAPGVEGGSHGAPMGPRAHHCDEWQHHEQGEEMEKAREGPSRVDMAGASRRGGAMSTATSARAATLERPHTRLLAGSSRRFIPGGPGRGFAMPTGPLRAAAAQLSSSSSRARSARARPLPTMDMDMDDDL